MDLYNPIIKQTEALFSASVPNVKRYSPAGCWAETKDFELVMMRDVAFELGGSGKPAVNFTCVTSDESLVPGDEIVVYGPDLQQLKGDSAFARITLLRSGSIDTAAGDTEAAFRAIQTLDFVKYHVFPKGYMIRTSSESNREQVRISKDALSHGISFEAIGNTFIKHYHENKNVLAAKVIFVTDPSIDYQTLIGSAKSVHDITMALSKLLEGMPTDCHTCKLKPICDEVEGMKELHFGQGKM